MRFPGNLRRFRGDDIAVDLGTANTVVFVRGHGIALFEPSVVAVDEATGEVLAVGAEARRMIGRTPATITATRPLRHGVIADFEVTEEMLRHFIRRTIGAGRRHPRVVLCVPSGITEVERRAVEEATLAAGARQASLIEEPMAAAIGADLPIAEPRASVVVDIGGGTTEVAVISLGDMVVWESIRVGGYEMDEAVVDHAKKQHGLLIGQERAEQVKIAIGSADDVERAGTAEVAGRDGLTGLLRRIEVTAEEVRWALEGPIVRIVDAVKETLERTPPELAADAVDRGIVLVGGGALLRGMDRRISAETELPVHVAESPLVCVAVGAGRSLEEFEAIARSSASPRRSWRGLR
ncbi:MAG TPA: rod shape-determining protein [Gaiellaceae bacterium]|nr:rod shape-determining protein [Gaiellaceae bacterium]